MARIAYNRLTDNKEKAATLILALSDENKKSLFKQLKEREIWLVTSSMSGLGVIEPGVLKNVLMDFMHLLKQGNAVTGSFDDTKKMLESVLGKDKAGAVLQGVVGDADGIWEQLSEVNTGMLSKFLQSEDPQTASVILSRLAPGRTAQILSAYEKDTSLDIVMRILGGAAVKGPVIQAIQSFLKNEFMEEFKRSADAFDAHKVVAEIMNAFEPSKADKFLESLEKAMPEDAARVRMLMFTFDDLLRIDGHDIQKIISSADKTQLALALKGVAQNLQDLFFNNMSERAAKLLRADMDAQGSVRLAEVEKAQRTILNLTKEMQREGQITIPEAGEEGALVS